MSHFDDDHFPDDDFDDDADSFDDDMDGVDGGDPPGDKKKLPVTKMLIAGIGSLIVVAAIIAGAMTFFGSGNNSEQISQNQEALQAEYERGRTEGEHKADAALAEKTAEIDKLTASIREAKGEAANASQRADNSDARNTDTLKDAQRAIDKLTAERDSYKVKLDQANSENDRLHSRIRVLESGAK